MVRSTCSEDSGFVERDGKGERQIFTRMVKKEERQAGRRRAERFWKEI